MTGRTLENSAKYNTLNLKHVNRPILQLVVELSVILVKSFWIICAQIVRLIVAPSEKPVKGEVVLVTGAGHGIGREIALKYASLEATVVCLDINEADNLKTVAEIKKLGNAKAYGYTCDVANCQQVMETAKKIQREIGDVTILVNNAGIMPARPFLDFKKEDVQRLYEINVFAHYWTLQAFLPKMQQNNKGHIVAIASCVGLAPVRNLTPYCSTKYAVRGLMMALAEELRVNSKSKINITIIYPYAIDTGLCKNAVVGIFGMDFLKAKYVAKCVVRAQRRNFFELSVPRHISTLFAVMQLLPTSVFRLLMDFSRTYIEFDY